MINNLIKFSSILIGIMFFHSCSKTYQDYNIDLDVEFDVTVDNQTWAIDTFSINEVSNTSTGDTATFNKIKIRAIDNSYPYPKQIVALVYFNTNTSSAEISTGINSDGLLAELQLNEIDLTYQDILFRYIIDKSKNMPPSLTIYNFDNKRNLISGIIEGMLYDIKSGKEVLVRIKCENIKIR